MPGREVAVVIRSREFFAFSPQIVAVAAPARTSHPRCRAVKSRHPRDLPSPCTGAFDCCRRDAAPRPARRSTRSRLIVLGTWIGRHVRESAGFFVAGRSLGPGLIFATFLAANIGAGSTVGATGYAYQDGLAAWWWNGSAGLGSLVLAFWVGPRLWRQAEQARLSDRRRLSRKPLRPRRCADWPRPSSGSAAS